MKTSFALAMVLSLGASSAALAVNVQRDRETNIHSHAVVTTCTLKRCPSSSTPQQKPAPPKGGTQGSGHGSNDHTNNSNNHTSGSNNHTSGGTHDDKQGNVNTGPGVIYVPSHPVAAPEVDPATAFAGLTLLAGALAVTRGRKARRS